MSPITHLLGSWLVAANSTRSLRDCRLVSLAGVLPDADGLPVVVDIANELLGRPETHYYGLYHHYYLHGIIGGLAMAGLLAAFAARRWRVFLLVLVVFHLHLLCDLVGSRGPDREDLWPIFYLGPWSKEPMWLWRSQWPLDSWLNRLISVALFLWCLLSAVKKGHSPVGIFNRRVDNVFVSVLQKWYAVLRGKRFASSASQN